LAKNLSAYLVYKLGAATAFKPLSAADGKA
jgi:hypothetical protein